MTTEDTIIYHRPDEKLVSANPYGVSTLICEAIIRGEDSREEFRAICIKGRWTGAEVWQLTATPTKWQAALTDPRFAVHLDY